MNKNQILKILNQKIDSLIIQGKTKTKAYKHLTRLHKKLIHA